MWPVNPVRSTHFDGLGGGAIAELQLFGRSDAPALAEDSLCGSSPSGGTTFVPVMKTADL
jgi:hypothetical protein